MKLIKHFKINKHFYMFSCANAALVIYFKRIYGNKEDKDNFIRRNCF